MVYRADHDVDNDDELYSVPVDGSQAPVKLNGALAAGGDVTHHQVANGIVTYRADQDEDDVFELYGVRPTAANRRSSSARHSPRAEMSTTTS